MNREDAEHRFDTAGGAEQVTRHRFRGADRNAIGSFAEDLFDRIRLDDIRHGGGAVRIDVADLIFGNTGVAMANSMQRTAPSPSSAGR